MNLKTQITKLHYDRNAKGLLFSLLKFCSIFYGIGSSAKNFLYDKGIIKPKIIVLLGSVALKNILGEILDKVVKGWIENAKNKDYKGIMIDNAEKSYTGGYLEKNRKVLSNNY